MTHFAGALKRLHFSIFIMLVFGATIAAAEPTLTPQPIPVALQIKAKDKVTEPRADAIVFGGPAGNGRRGALGVLLRSAPSTGNGGSKWSFEWTWTESAFGVQVFHPKGRGQVVINLAHDKVGLCTPKAWREVGYAVVDTSRVRPTPAARRIFPLKAGVPYSVVSTLSAGGQYTLEINGEAVAKGRVSTTYPLSLELKPGERPPETGHGKLEWTGENLPVQWSAGYAALLLGPTDPTPNVVRNVFFTTDTAQ